MPHPMTSASYQCTVLGDSFPLPASQSVTKPCNIAQSKITRSARPFFTDQYHSTVSMAAAASSDKAVRSLLSGLRPNMMVESLEIVPSAQLQLQYNVKTADGSSLTLSLPPPAVMRLLRSEQSSIGAEATILEWLGGLAKDQGLIPSSNQDKDNHNRSTLRRVGASDTIDCLIDYLPILVEHGAIPGRLSAEYNLSRPPRGTTIAQLTRPLAFLERKVVDYQTGQLVHRISKQLSPNQRFGLAADVLSIQQQTNMTQRHSIPGFSSTTGDADRWPVAFHSLLESALRDAEDLSVMIGYGTIRRQLRRFEHLLDAVTIPKLVVIDAADDSNTLVFRSPNAIKVGAEMTKEYLSKQGPSRPNRKYRKAKRSRPQTPGSFNITDSSEENSEESTSECECEGTEEQLAYLDTHGHRLIEVTGLRQWNNCLFGDPLIAAVFNRQPSANFKRGFQWPLPGGALASTSTEAIEDLANAHIRLLLYECYHSIVAVVREYCRPQSDSSQREMEARKKLSGALAQLDAIDDDGVVRRRPSAEAPQAKRPKPDCS